LGTVLRDGAFGSKQVRRSPFDMMVRMRFFEVGGW
jgi:hypothetical protein